MALAFIVQNDRWHRKIDAQVLKICKGTKLQLNMTAIFFIS